MEASNDVATAKNVQNFTPTNWFTIPNGSFTITAGGSAMLQVAPICYQYVRAKFTRSGGGGAGTTIVVLCNVQGV